MSDSPYHALDEPQPSVWRRVDAICDRFEAEWRGGQRVRVEDYLSDSGGPDRAVLLRELVAVELAYRRRNGEHPTLGEYQGRFSTDVDLIREVFREVGSKAVPTLPGPSRNGEPDIEIVSGEPNRVSPFDTALHEAPGQTGSPLALDSEDEYTNLREISRGGMGIVYRAWQQSAQRYVALKVIRPDILAELTPEQRHHWLARFRREIQLTAQIDHDRVVQVYAVGEWNGQPFYTMRFITGRSLAGVLRDGVLPNHKAALYLEQVARAVQSAHDQRIYHRDIKPRNILVNHQELPFLADFGLARWAEETADPPVVGTVASAEAHTALTPAGKAIGTPPYMPPEQVMDATSVTGHSDVYSLGATLYEMVTGRPPFKAATEQETLTQVLETPPVKPRLLNRVVDRDLETIILTCLQKAPADRYASAAELADDLGRYLRREPIKARPLGWAKRLLYWARRKPALATVAALFVLAVATIVGTTIGLIVQQQKAVHDSQRYSAGLLRDKAIQQCERGEVADGLLLLIRSLELAPPLDEDLRRTLRLNLTGWARQLPTLLIPPIRHDALVTAVALSPDESKFVTAGKDGMCRVFETATGKELFKLRGHKGEVHAAAWSPDGRTILTGGQDRTARLWNAETGDERGRVHAPDPIWAVTWSPQGEQFVTGARKELVAKAEPPVQVWNAKNLQVVQTLRGHTKALLSVAFHPAGDKLLTGSADKTARLWDLSTGAAIHVLGNPLPPGEEESGVAAVAFAQDGKSFLTAGFQKGSILRWDTETGKPIPPTIRRGGTVNALALSQNGEFFITAESTKTAQLFDTSLDTPRGLPIRHQGSIRAVALGRDGNLVVTGSDDRTACVWRMPPRSDTGRLLPHLGWVSDVVLARDGKTAATSSGDNLKEKGYRGEARLIDLVTGEFLPQRFPHKYWVQAVAISPDGELIATGSNDRTVQIWKLKTGDKVGDPLPHPNWLSHVVFSPDGNYLLTSTIGSKAVARLWNARMRSVVHEWSHAGTVVAAVFHPTDPIVLTACKDGTARLWDTLTGQPIGQPLQHEREVTAASFSPDGSKILTVSLDGTARIWRTDTRTEVFRLAGHQGGVLAAVFSPKGNFIVTGGTDFHARIWNAHTGEVAGRPLSHAHDVRAVAFSPDESMVLTGSDDSTARFWDRLTGIPLGPPLQHGKKVMALTFSQDGRLALTTSWDKGLRIWPVPTRMEGDLDRIKLWLQTATGTELGTHDLPRELDAAAWQERRERLERLGGSPLP